MKYSAVGALGRRWQWYVKDRGPKSCWRFAGESECFQREDRMASSCLCVGVRHIE